ncbi:putative small secreted protein [Arthrobacter pigmenti]|uniref:Putative small secreted protein n=1 Tax=Arthrobacter pigmenti TaxID=271432 RepID=A0A846RLS9_9MICC|nr:hypothetical protein [Arthrobacter pigmenti]NJC21077.1 putative small secreted protein [Arthrobacter pigmenti]
MSVNSRTPVVGVGLLSVVLLVAGCGTARGTGGEIAGGVNEIAADYPVYKTAEKLVDASNLIIEGEVQNSRYDVMYPMPFSGDDPELNPYAGTGNEPSDREIADMRVPVTVYSVLVTKVHEGSATPGGMVEIHRTGGEMSGEQYVELGAADVELGKSYLLYLDQVDGHPAGIVGGDAGLFEEVAEGTFSSAMGEIESSDVRTLK